MEHGRTTNQLRVTPTEEMHETGEDNAAAHLGSLTVGHEVIVLVTEGALDLEP